VVSSTTASNPRSHLTRSITAVIITARPGLTLSRPPSCRCSTNGRTWAGALRTLLVAAALWQLKRVA
jgi:hypothetical protein